MTLSTSPDLPNNPQALLDRSVTLGSQMTLVEQLVYWAEHRIQEQVFRPGMRMPSVRQLATDRGVSRSTVVEAYERLVVRGHLQARRGSGFFVREPTASPARTPVTKKSRRDLSLFFILIFCCCIDKSISYLPNS